ncbi:hypothetical protein [Sphingobium cloacae]|uniref:Phage holin family protein n=1 Tax=Sphingobium cloacae TaxID=120107 RepID=A0A1E1F0W6_9SPHN|nr:hypothetical protein [Sphingobium cloacae]BAV64155.1 hypothetical protein SCLO_1011150 [Sphingobium cloacae]
MTQEPGETVETPQTDGRDESVRDSIARLYADGRAYAEAEVERQKLRAGLAAAGVRDAAILGGLALMLLFGVIVAGLVGLIFGLAPMLGPLGATGAVLGGTLLVVLLLLLLAKARIGRMKRAMKP